MDFLLQKISPLQHSTEKLIESLSYIRCGKLKESAKGLLSEVLYVLGAVQILYCLEIQCEFNLSHLGVSCCFRVASGSSTANKSSDERAQNFLLTHGPVGESSQIKQNKKQTNKHPTVLSSEAGEETFVQPYYTIDKSF